MDWMAMASLWLPNRDYEREREGGEEVGDVSRTRWLRPDSKSQTNSQEGRAPFFTSLLRKKQKNKTEGRGNMNMKMRLRGVLTQAALSL